MTSRSNIAEANVTRATGEPLTGQFIQPTGARRETSPWSFCFQGLTRFLPTGKPGGSLAKFGGRVRTDRPGTLIARLAVLGASVLPAAHLCSAWVFRPCRAVLGLVRATKRPEPASAGYGWDGRMAMTRVGAPLPPWIFIGSAIRV